MKKKILAFTLAEVLITLGIIGVVAAITLPTLISSHKKSVAETRLKKFYSTINKGIEPFLNGIAMSTWDGDINKLITLNPGHAAKVIQLNGWKIPKDYPIRF